MRVLMLTQKIDRHDDVLGFTHDWAAALAARVEHLYIVALETGDYDLPPNVTVESMGKEAGRNRPGRLLGFYRGLLRHIGQVDAIFVHMIARYALLAAPVAALYGRPITLWYVHRIPGPELKLAVPLVKHIATAHATTFPLPSDKVRVLGHGIDVNTFAPGEKLPADPPMVVSLGRLSPIKRHETLIRAAARLRDQYGDPPARYAIVGGAVPDRFPDYKDTVLAEIDRLRLGDRVTLWGPVPAEGVAAVFHEASVAVNFSPPGSFDKAALESMLCGVPTIVANPAFDALLGEHADLLRIPAGDDVNGLAQRLRDLLALTPEARRAIGLQLRERTAAAHSLDGLMDRLVALMASDG